jgi:hypothetical protein
MRPTNGEENYFPNFGSKIDNTTIIFFKVFIFRIKFLKQTQLLTRNITIYKRNLYV